MFEIVLVVGIVAFVGYMEHVIDSVNQDLDALTVDEIF